MRKLNPVICVPLLWAILCLIVVVVGRALGEECYVRGDGTLVVKEDGARWSVKEGGRVIPTKLPAARGVLRAARARGESVAVCTNIVIDVGKARKDLLSDADGFIDEASSCVSNVCPGAVDSP